MMKCYSSCWSYKHGHKMDIKSKTVYKQTWRNRLNLTSINAIILLSPNNNNAPMTHGLMKMSSWCSHYKKKKKSQSHGLVLSSNMMSCGAHTKNRVWFATILGLKQCVEVIDYIDYENKMIGVERVNASHR